MAFGDDEHIKRLNRRELENLFRYVIKSREDLNIIISQQSKEICELHRKIKNQSRQLSGMQAALERRNRLLREHGIEVD